MLGFTGIQGNPSSSWRVELVASTVLQYWVVSFGSEQGDQRFDRCMATWLADYFAGFGFRGIVCLFACSAIRLSTKQVFA